MYRIHFLQLLMLCLNLIISPCSSCCNPSSKVATSFSLFHLTISGQVGPLCHLRSFCGPRVRRDSADNSSTKLDTFIPRVITRSLKKGARRVLRPLELASASPRIARASLSCHHIFGRVRFELWPFNSSIHLFLSLPSVTNVPRQCKLLSLF